MCDGTDRVRYPTNPLQTFKNTEVDLQRRPITVVVDFGCGLYEHNVQKFDVLIQIRSNVLRRGVRQWTVSWEDAQNGEPRGTEKFLRKG